MHMDVSLPTDTYRVNEVITIIRIRSGALIMYA